MQTEVMQTLADTSLLSKEEGFIIAADTFSCTNFLVGAMMPYLYYIA
jgi:hypothetical protein